MSLSAILSRLDLSEIENERLVHLLMSSVAGFLPGSEMDPGSAKLLGDISDALSRRRPHWNEIGERGFLWCGQLPEFVGCMLERLQSDADTQRRKAVRATRHPLIEKPIFAQAVGATPNFNNFIQRLLPSEKRIAHTSTYYHYYESTTDRVEPHLDTEEFALSCLLLVRHEYQGSSASRFYICPPGRGPIEVPLRVGDALVFYSGSVVHARSPPALGELVTTASWGFRVSDAA